jgi:nucleotide-binding universal stress UspA family protein
MDLFQNILVGVEFSGSNQLAPAVHQAVHSAVSLASEMSAAVTFVSMRGGFVPEDEMEQVLAALVRYAQESGARASALPERNADAETMADLAQRHQHDLVMIGAPHMTGWAATLFGNTATRLIRDCPIPVWLALPGVEPRPRNLLIATDLTAVSDIAVSLGVRLAQSLNIRAYFLHVVDYPLDHHWSTGDRDPLTNAYHREVRGAAGKTLYEQFQRFRGTSGIDAELHVVGRTGVPELEILHFIQEHPIDLVVLGEPPQNRLAAAVIGNTTEWLLPELPCSLLSVKPVRAIVH